VPLRRAHKLDLRVTAPALVVTALLLLAGCASSASPNTNGRIRIVAAESSWGSIAAQVGGAKVDVRSIISDPAEDPHSYEANAADTRLLATAKLSIVNGLGYDKWASRILAANPGHGAVLDVGHLLRLTDRDNPHRWYEPGDVTRVANAIAARLERLAPHDASYFKAHLTAFERRALSRYHALIGRIKNTYRGTPVGASESIFALLAPFLGLRLLTPPSFMKAVTEGTEVTAQDTVTAQRQITSRLIKVWIYNSQNATPVIQRLNALARRARIPITTITETMTPPTSTFQAWQVAQLRRLDLALRHATGH
jgi:zinc/manganese transport system substrate-binding protein